MRSSGASSMVRQGALFWVGIGSKVHHPALPGKRRGLALPTAHVGGTEVPDGQIRGLQQVIDQAESPFSAAHMDVYHTGLSGGQGP